MIAFLVVFAAAGTWSGNPVVGVLAGVAAGVASVWFYPTTRCWWCRGDAKRMDSWRTSWHGCLICRGSGRRKRVLARLIGGIDD